MTMVAAATCMHAYACPRADMQGGGDAEVLVWQRLLTTALSQDADAIIDAGALLAGVDLR